MHDHIVQSYYQPTARDKFAAGLRSAVFSVAALLVFAGFLAGLVAS